MNKYGLTLFCSSIDTMGLPRWLLSVLSVRVERQAMQDHLHVQLAPLAKQRLVLALHLVLTALKANLLIEPAKALVIYAELENTQTLQGPEAARNVQQGRTVRR